MIIHDLVWFFLWLQKKLLKKQAAGKKRMKQFGKVEVPQEAFMAVLKVNKTDTSGPDE